MPAVEIQEADLVAAVNYAAYVVVTYGDAYAPTFERLERELVDYRQRQNPVARARALLAARTVEGVRRIA